MFKVVRVNEQRLDIFMSGMLDRQEMEKAVNALLSQGENIQHGRMLFEVEEYHLPSLGAIVYEFSRLPALLEFVSQFEKAAVLSDEVWLKIISEMEGELYPGLEIKAFDRKQREQAENWLAS